MPRYKVSSDINAKQFNVKPEYLDKFLAEYPGAVLVEETPPTENFQNGDAETDASVTPVNPSRSINDRGSSARRYGITLGKYFFGFSFKY